MTSLLLLKSMLFDNALKQKPKMRTMKAKIKKVPDNKPTKVLRDMCRICDQEKGEIPIFNNCVQPNLPEDILQFSGVTVDKSDSLSKHMCQKCLNLLNGCIMFKKICQKTNKKIIKRANIKKESNLKIENVYEQVSDTQRFNDSDDGEDFQDKSSDIRCLWCGKGYLDLAALDGHLQICKHKTFFENPAMPSEETLEKRFLCDICGKTSFSNANLLTHMTIHEDIFPFKCNECPYMGRTINLLKNHKRSHLTEKPFKCPQCDKRTSTSSNLTKHIRTVHHTSRPYKCNYCAKTFTCQQYTKTHIRTIHLRQGTVECDICFKSFNHRKILRRHQRKIHKIKSESGGRLPAYLQRQTKDQSDNHNHTDEGESDQMFLT